MHILLLQQSLPETEAMNALPQDRNKAMQKSGNGSKEYQQGIHDSIELVTPVEYPPQVSYTLPAQALLIRANKKAVNVMMRISSETQSLSTDDGNLAMTIMPFPALPKAIVGYLCNLIIRNITTE